MSTKTKVKRRKSKLPAVDEDLLISRDQLTELAYDLRDAGLLIAANHCDEAVAEIEDHLDRTGGTP